VEPRVATWLAREVPDVSHGFGTLRIQGSDPNHTLEQAAHYLRSAGLTGKWRDEPLAVMDEQGRRHAVLERAAVRPLGVRTVAVHLMGFDPRGHVWLQQRALDKATDPGMWDTLVGGLVAAAEPSLEAAIMRESWEEAGLRTQQLTLRSSGTVRERRPVDDAGYLVEDLVLFEAALPEGFAPVNQDGEVAKFALLPVKTVLEMLHADQFTLEAALMLGESFLQRGLLR
jgi:8-oxo-dGTP pyrophosphatase MutT (NUDIX family)